MKALMEICLDGALAGLLHAYELAPQVAMMVVSAKPNKVIGKASGENGNYGFIFLVRLVPVLLCRTSERA